MVLPNCLADSYKKSSFINIIGPEYSRLYVFCLKITLVNYVLLFLICIPKERLPNGIFLHILFNLPYYHFGFRVTGRTLFVCLFLTLLQTAGVGERLSVS